MILHLSLIVTLPGIWSTWKAFLGQQRLTQRTWMRDKKKSSKECCPKNALGKWASTSPRWKQAAGTDIPQESYLSGCWFPLLTWKPKEKMQTLEERKERKKNYIVEVSEDLPTSSALCCNYRYFHYSTREVSNNLEIKIHIVRRVRNQCQEDFWWSQPSRERSSRQRVFFSPGHYYKRDKVFYSLPWMCQKVMSLL